MSEPFSETVVRLLAIEAEKIRIENGYYFDVQRVDRFKRSGGSLEERPCILVWCAGFDGNVQGFGYNASLEIAFRGYLSPVVPADETTDQHRGRFQDDIVTMLLGAFNPLVPNELTAWSDLATYRSLPMHEAADTDPVDGVEVRAFVRYRHRRETTRTLIGLGPSQ